MRNAKLQERDGTGRTATVGAVRRVKTPAQARRKPSAPAVAPREIFEMLFSVGEMISDGLAEAGLDEGVVRSGGFRVERFSSARERGCVYMCTLTAAPGLGVEQPLTAMVRTDEDLDAEALAAAFVAEIVFVHGMREEIAAMRDALQRGVAEVVLEAESEGLVLELRAIDLVGYDPACPLKDFRGDRYQLFDVEMLLLGDDRGQIEFDLYQMDAWEADEFASYLRRRILPEQRALMARRGTGQDV